MKKKRFAALWGTMLIFAMVRCTNVSAEELDETEITNYEQWENGDIESNFVSIPITYAKEEYYSTVIPKNIVLDSDGKADFTISIKGNISPAYVLRFEMVDMVEEKEGTNFYMRNSGVKVLVDVIQPKTVWDYEDVMNGVEVTDKILLETAYPGEWEGEFYFNIRKEKVNAGHRHEYFEKILVQPTCTEEGLLLYECDCGVHYMEYIDTAEHNYLEGYCVICGEEDGDDGGEWGDEEWDVNEFDGNLEVWNEMRI